MYKNEPEAQQMMESCEQDDFILETARGLIATAVKELMQMRQIDRQTARD